MAKPVRIVPSILVKNQTDFKQQFTKMKKSFKYLQIDIMDGIFVGSKNTLNPAIIKNMTRGYKLEIHLMVKDVAKYVNQWVVLNNVKKIIWHYEAEKNDKANLCLAKWLKKNKIQSGLAINPHTSLGKIKNIIPYFHTIQIMGVTPGQQGQRFQAKVLKKIEALRRKYPKLNIAIDGGVNDRTFPAIKKAGANIICPGSYFQQAKNIKEALKKIAN